MFQKSETFSQLVLALEANKDSADLAKNLIFERKETFPAEDEENHLKFQIVSVFVLRN
jgi:hypothetical protein